MKEILANMAGIVLHVLTSPGTIVTDGEHVITLESMKMEVALHANASGVIKKIKVNIGDFVNEGDVLVVLE